MAQMFGEAGYRLTALGNVFEPHADLFWVDAGKVTRRGGLFGVEAHRTPSRYRLTWIGTIKPACRPTNEWKRFRQKIKSPHPHVGTEETASTQQKVA